MFCTLTGHILFLLLVYCVSTWDSFFEMEVMSVKKLLLIIPSVLLLAAAGLLLLCKRHADQTGLACLDSDL